jgi:hypothetical protein
MSTVKKSQLIDLTLSSISLFLNTGFGLQCATVGRQLARKVQSTYKQLHIGKKRNYVALTPTISMEREKGMRKQPSAPMAAIILNI